MSLLNRIALGFLELVMGLSFLASGFFIVTWPSRESSETAAEYVAEQGGFKGSLDQEAVSARRLARAVNPLGSLPTCFVLSAGFLALIYSQRRSDATIVAAITAIASPPPKR